MLPNINSFHKVYSHKKNPHRASYSIGILYAIYAIIAIICILESSHESFALFSCYSFSSTQSSYPSILLITKHDIYYHSHSGNISIFLSFHILNRYALLSLNHSSITGRTYLEKFPTISPLQISIVPSTSSSR